MRKTIYKYTLHLKDGTEHNIRMPVGAQILHLGVQGEDICIWALVNLLPEEYTDRQFFIMGTGDPFEFNYNWTPHVGTVQMLKENEWGSHEYVWHIFERLDPDTLRQKGLQ